MDHVRGWIAYRCSHTPTHTHTHTVCLRLFVGGEDFEARDNFFFAGKIPGMLRIDIYTCVPDTKQKIILWVNFQHQFCKSKFSHEAGGEGTKRICGITVFVYPPPLP